MLAELETLVRVESPTDDLSACRKVVATASDIAAKVLGTPAQIQEVRSSCFLAGSIATKSYSFGAPRYSLAT